MRSLISDHPRLSPRIQALLFITQLRNEITLTEMSVVDQELRGRNLERCICCSPHGQVFHFKTSGFPHRSPGDFLGLDEFPLAPLRFSAEGKKDDHFPFPRFIWFFK